MFRIFKRRKDKPALTYGVLQKLGEITERRERKIADYLNGKTKSFSKRKWVLFLSVFCVATGGIATFILVSSVRMKQKDNSGKEWKQNSISIPSSVLQQGKQWDTLRVLEEIYAHRKDSVFQKQNVHH